MYMKKRLKMNNIKFNRNSHVQYVFSGRLFVYTCAMSVILSGE